MMAQLIMAFASAALAVLLLRIAADVAARVGEPLQLRVHEWCSIVAGIAVLGFVIASKHGVATCVCLLPGVAVAAVSAVTDLKSGYIYDRVLVVGLMVVLAAAVFERILVVAIIGGAIGAGIPFLLYIATRGCGLGLGDVKLAGMLGVSMGPRGVLGTLAIASVAGGVAACYLVATHRRHRRDSMPFAPFLAFGGALTVIGTLL